MANTNAPFGLRPVRKLGSGGSFNMEMAKAYYVPSTDATALYIGDPVVLIGTGNAAAFMDYPIGALPTVGIATGGDVSSQARQVLGSVVGILPVHNQSLIYRPASTEAIVMVADDPNIVFELQDDGGGTPAVTWIGSNANLISGAGSTTTGLSGWALDGGTSDGPDGDASNQLLIVGLTYRPGGQGQEVGDYAVWEVLINEHCYLKRAVLGTTV